MTSDTEHAQGVDADIETHVVTHLWVGLALVAEEDVRGALETSHVARLLLRGLLDRVNRLLALFTVDDSFVFSATIDVRDLMLLFTLGRLTSVITVSVDDIDINELSYVSVISESLQEGAILVLLINIDEEFGIVASGAGSVRGGHEDFTCLLHKHLRRDKVLFRFDHLLSRFLGQEVDQSLKLVV